MANNGTGVSKYLADDGTAVVYNDEVDIAAVWTLELAEAKAMGSAQKTFYCVRNKTTGRYLRLTACCCVAAWPHRPLPTGCLL